MLGLGRIIAFAAAGFALVLVGFSFSRILWLSLLIVPLGGCAMLISFASATTILQTLTDDRKRGRVMSFFTMAFVGMTPWGNLLAGNASDWLGGGIGGAARTMQIAAGVSLLAALSFARKLPGLRATVRSIYVDKGILPHDTATNLETAAGMQTATDVVAAATEQ